MAIKGYENEVLLNIDGELETSDDTGGPSSRRRAPVSSRLTKGTSQI